MSEIDGESFLGIVDIPKYPSSRGIKTARSYHPWQMSPWEFYPFDQVAPMLFNGWIYFGTYDMDKRNLKLALECPELICAPDVDNHSTISEFNLCHDSLFSFDGR